MRCEKLTIVKSSQKNIGLVIIDTAIFSIVGIIAFVLIGMVALMLFAIVVFIIISL